MDNITVTEQLTPGVFTPYAGPNGPIIVAASQNVQYPTSQAFVNENLYITGFLKGFKFFSIPLKIVVCGDELIKATKNLLPYSKDRKVGLEILDAVLPLFTVNHSYCINDTI